MHVRLYKPGDGASIDRILAPLPFHNVRLPKQNQQTGAMEGDFIVVGGLESSKFDKLQGVTAGRMVMFVHCFELDESLNGMKRTLANGLFEYGRGFMKSEGVQEMVFLVDKKNDAMKRFMEERKATVQPGEFDIYCLKVE